ncbi:hypothetical protein GCM10010376_05700 [Streptomyces violaceusniger]
MFGCADAEQMQAAGEHRSGSIGEGQPGTVDGRGFVLVGGQGRAIVMKPEEGIGDADEMPSELVGGTMPGGGLEDPGVIGEEAEKAGLGGVVVDPGLGPELGRDAEPAGVPHQSAGTGMGVLNPEEGVVLTLGEKTGGVEIGQIMPGGPEQRPAGGVGPEGAEQLSPGDGNRPNNRPLTRNNDSPDGVDEPPHNMSDQGGPHLARSPKGDRNPGKRLSVPVARALGEDVPHELGMGGGIKGDVEKPGVGDVNAGDPGRTEKPPPQNLGDTQRIPTASGQQQSNISGVIPTPGPRRGPHLHPLRHGNAQLVVLNGTTHGVQHSAGELGGSHGTSVWEEGGTKANRFRPSDGTRKPDTKPEPELPGAHRRKRRREHTGETGPAPSGPRGNRTRGPGPTHYPVGPTTGSASPGATAPVAPAAPCRISRRTSSTRSTGSKGFARKASTPSAFPLSISYCVHALMIATGT